MVDKWYAETDLLIAGSGAGALTAAIIACDKGLDVLVLEKSPYCGGATAMSGGVVWVPNNHLMKAAGIEDNPQDAYAYLARCVSGRVPDVKLRTYLRYAPQMLSYLQINTEVKFYTLPEYPDYYPGILGSRPGGRSCEALPYDGQALGEAFIKLRPPHPQELVFGRLMLTAPEARHVLPGNADAMMQIVDTLSHYLFNIKARLKGKRDTRLTLGNALMGRLFNTVLEREIPVWLNSPVIELVEENGTVVGAIAEFDGQRRAIKANKGVLLAAGGFERNRDMRAQYQRHPVSEEWTAAHAYNTGDAIRMAQGAGAALDLMDEAWWMPVCAVPDAREAWMLLLEKTLPGSILVDSAGRRFVNEAAPYIDIVNAMYKRQGPRVSAIPAYLIFDSRFRYNYITGPLMPGKFVPDFLVPARLRKHFLYKEDTLSDLAGALGIDAGGLEQTIVLFNEFAKTGRDIEFQRGENIYDQYYGDPRVKPNPSLGRLDKPPFYAIKVLPGDLGTKGGLQTDRFGRVQRVDGSVITGLYAVGNSSASVMGRTYPGAGATIGPAMTFGYLAALHAAGQLEE